MLDTKFGSLKLWQAFVFFLLAMLVFSLASYMIANSPTRRSAKAKLPPKDTTTTETEETEDEPVVG